jgi:hypothetical protein
MITDDLNRREMLYQAGRDAVRDAIRGIDLTPSERTIAAEATGLIFAIAWQFERIGDALESIEERLKEIGDHTCAMTDVLEVDPEPPPPRRWRRRR